MRYDHVGANGNPGMRTPALDALSAAGLNFHRCYTQNGVCMPSRCSFMTGLYPQQTGVTRNGIALPADFSPTVATGFGTAGFQTIQIGKLHFQPHEDMDFDPGPRHPYGFDVFWCSEERGNYSDAYYHWLEGKYPQYAAAFRVPRSSDPARHAAEEAPRAIDAPWQATHAGWIADAAQRALSSRRNERVFMHLGFYNPHPPLTPVREALEAYKGVVLPTPDLQHPDELDQKPEALLRMLRSRRDWSPENFATYRRGLAAMVTEMDLAIGGLVEWLRQANLLDDTLLVFSSDHGDMAGDHSMTHKDNHFYEQVMRVPLIMHWPSGLEGRRREANGLFEMTDLLPTLLELSGAPVPGQMAGASVGASLLAGESPRGRESVYAYSDPGWAMVRTEKMKYLVFQDADNEVLYDLEKDPGERVNVAGETRYAGTVAEMRAMLLTRTLTAARSRLPRHHPY